LPDPSELLANKVVYLCILCKNVIQVLASALTLSSKIRSVGVIICLCDFVMLDHVNGVLCHQGTRTAFEYDEAVVEMLQVGPE